MPLRVLHPSYLQKKVGLLLAWSREEGYTIFCYTVYIRLYYRAYKAATDENCGSGAGFPLAGCACYKHRYWSSAAAATCTWNNVSGSQSSVSEAVLNEARMMFGVGESYRGVGGWSFRSSWNLSEDLATSRRFCSCVVDVGTLILGHVLSVVFSSWNLFHKIIYGLVSRRKKKKKKWEWVGREFFVWVGRSRDPCLRCVGWYSGIWKCVVLLFDSSTVEVLGLLF